MDATNDITRFEVTNEAATHLASMRKWTLFLAIMGFIGSGFLLLAGLFFGLMSRVAPSTEGISRLPGTFMLVLYALMAVLYLFPSWFLLNFSTRIKQALQSQASSSLAEALKYLKFHFTFFGVMAIVGMFVVVFGIFAAIGIAIFTRMHAGS